MSDPHPPSVSAADQDSELERKWSVKTRLNAGEHVTAYLLNCHQSTVLVEPKKPPHSAFFLYFVDLEGSLRRVTRLFQPYLLVSLRESVHGYRPQLSLLEPELEDFLEALLDNALPDAARRISFQKRVDTSGSAYFAKPPSNDRFSHAAESGEILSGEAYKQKSFVCLTMNSFEDLEKARRVLRNVLKDNERSLEDAERELRQDLTGKLQEVQRKRAEEEPKLLLEEMFEWDIAPTARFLINNNLRCGQWYHLHRPLPRKDDSRSAHMHERPGGGAHGEMEELNVQIQLSSNQRLVPPLRILAWDIETHKDPLKFPDAERDAVMCISYQTESGGFLLVNREYFSSSIRNFRYSPTSTGEYAASFKCYNFWNEKSMLEFFIFHVRSVLRPHVIVSYNGDSFDFPYTNTRAAMHGLSLHAEWGFKAIRPLGRVGAGLTGGPLVKPTFESKFVTHMDCLKWVERDSYLPCGSRGLKAVSKSKLFYEAREVDPELMVEYCRTKPQTMAEYSVSDAVATYNIYMKYVHGFTLALSSIIPLRPDDVLRKGSGTLCESLLMAEAWRKGICIPNKKIQDDEKWIGNHLLHSETYVGGNVEQLRAGIFRDDISETFVFDADTIDLLIEDLHLTFVCYLTRELNISPSAVIDSNWAEIAAEIESRLRMFKSLRTLTVEPLIYHMDVAAMYPNVILSQRLQPYAIVKESDCHTCVYGDAQSQCQRTLEWNWKGERYTLDRSDINAIDNQLKVELHDRREPDGSVSRVTWFKLSPLEQSMIRKARLKQLGACLNHNKFKLTVGELRKDICCQRAASFYVDTVRDFRDRRGLYKIEKKKAEMAKERYLAAELEESRGGHPSGSHSSGASASGSSGKSSRGQAERHAARIQAENDVIMYDSLQLAHKCILNSFYGYVMRRGARWYSLEMAAIVTHTGANVIKQARDICAGVGIPLELDTDGVWTLLPKGFPDNFDLELSVKCPDSASSDSANQSSFAKSSPRLIRKRFSFPCAMLNAQVEKRWANKQYHRLTSSANKSLTANSPTSEAQYEVSSENSVGFEIDGPYKAIFLPASEKEDKQLKKRYAVYDFDNRIAELKGFELKRRGELQLLKAFQADVFPQFVHEDLIVATGSTGRRGDGMLSGRGSIRNPPTLESTAKASNSRPESAAWGSVVLSKREALYRCVSEVAERWVRFLRSRGRSAGADLATVIALLEESTTLSKSVEDAGSYKSMGITAAKRLADLRQDQTYTKHSGVRAAYVVSALPVDQPRTARAIPALLFAESPPIRNAWLLKWIGLNPSAIGLNPSTLTGASAASTGIGVSGNGVENGEANQAKSVDDAIPTASDSELLSGTIVAAAMRQTKLPGRGPSAEGAAAAVGSDGWALNFLDWDYYLERLVTAIQKIIVVPAELQKVPNPCSVPAPAWLSARAAALAAKLRGDQRSLLSFGLKPRPISAPRITDAHITDAHMADAALPDDGPSTLKKATWMPEAAFSSDGLNDENRPLRQPVSESLVIDLKDVSAAASHSLLGSRAQRGFDTLADLVTAAGQVWKHWERDPRLDLMPQFARSRLAVQAKDLVDKGARLVDVALSSMPAHLEVLERLQAGGCENESESGSSAADLACSKKVRAVLALPCQVSLVSVPIVQHRQFVLGRALNAEVLRATIGRSQTEPATFIDLSTPCEGTTTPCEGTTNPCEGTESLFEGKPRDREKDKDKESDRIKDKIKDREKEAASLHIDKSFLKLSGVFSLSKGSRARTMDILSLSTVATDFLLLRLFEGRFLARRQGDSTLSASALAELTNNQKELTLSLGQGASQGGLFTTPLSASAGEAVNNVMSMLIDHNTGVCETLPAFVTVGQTRERKRLFLIPDLAASALYTSHQPQLQAHSSLLSQNSSDVPKKNDFALSIDFFSGRKFHLSLLTSSVLKSRAPIKLILEKCHADAAAVSIRQVQNLAESLASLRARTNGKDGRRSKSRSCFVAEVPSQWSVWDMVASMEARESAADSAPSLTPRIHISCFSADLQLPPNRGGFVGDGNDLDNHCEFNLPRKLRGGIDFSFAVKPMDFVRIGALASTKASGRGENCSRTINTLMRDILTIVSTVVHSEADDFSVSALTLGSRLRLCLQAYLGAEDWEAQRLVISPPVNPPIVNSPNSQALQSLPSLSPIPRFVCVREECVLWFQRARALYSSVADSGPNYSRDLLTHYPMLAAQFGGACVDGAVDSGFQKLFPTFSRASLRTVTPGVYRNTVLYFQCKAPLWLHALILLPEIAKAIGVQLPTPPSNPMAPKMSNSAQDGGSRHTLTNAGAITKRDHLLKTSSSSRQSYERGFPYIQDGSRHPNGGDVTGRLLLLRQFILTFLFGRTAHTHNQSHTQRLNHTHWSDACSEYQLHLLTNWLSVSDDTSDEIPHLMAEIHAKWSRFLLRLIGQTLQSLSAKTSLGMTLVSAWTSGLLISLPTQNPRKAEAAASLLSAALNQTPEISGLICSKSVAYFTRTLFLDDRNCLCLTDSPNEMHIMLPALEGLPTPTIRLVEGFLIAFLKSGGPISDSQTHSHSYAQMQALFRSFFVSVMHNLGLSDEGESSGLVKAHDPQGLQTSEAQQKSETQQGPMFCSVIPASTKGCPMNAGKSWLSSFSGERRETKEWLELASTRCPTGLQKILGLVWMAVEVDPLYSAGMDEEQRKAWLEGLEVSDILGSDLEDFFYREDETKKLVYSTNVAVLLPNVTCVSCHQTETFDLSASPTRFSCTSCDVEHDEGLLEAKLVSLLETHILHLQNRTITCSNCSLPPSTRCAFFCQCGGTFDFATRVPPTAPFLQIFHQIIRNKPPQTFPWLEAVLTDITALLC